MATPVTRTSHHSEFFRWSQNWITKKRFVHHRQQQALCSEWSISPSMDHGPSDYCICLYKMIIHVYYYIYWFTIHTSHQYVHHYRKVLVQILHKHVFIHTSHHITSYHITYIALPCIALHCLALPCVTMQCNTIP